MCLVFLLSRLVSVFWTGDEAIDGLRTQLLERILKACGGDQIHTSTHTVGFIGNGSGKGVLAHVVRYGLPVASS